ncbi:MarR family transcriptional regulator [Agromyces mediolanus]|uniref:MarR family winged helix-turn-helix transcriptional regulator n=1 Tax=Agromyces mediolanus TaxID=41986 RepID=UPI0038334607
MGTDFTSLPTWVLSSAASRAHQVLHASLGRAGVTGYEFRCLSALASTERLSQTELGEAAALDPRDVTHTVRALESRGLVSRVKDPGHGRRQLVSLTAEGRVEGERAAEAITEAQEAAFGGLTGEERTALLALLDRVARG